MSRRAHRERRTAAGVHLLPWRQIANPFAPMEPLSADHVQAIIDGALEVLESYGMRFLEPASRALLARAGAQVDENSMMVRFDRGLVREQLAHAPREFALRARNPQHDLHIGGNRIVFGAVGGPAFVSDLDRGRRPGTYAEQCDFIRLLQSLPIIHQEGGGPFEAMDLPPESRHLDLYLAQLTLTDKNAQGIVLGRERTLDCIAMHEIALGTDRAGLAERPAIMAIVNTNSPLQLDIPMTEGVVELASAGQVTCITPFTLAGSMSPATLAGTLVQQTAEVLAVTVLAQLVRRGRAGDVRLLRLERRHAERRAGARHAGVHQGGAGERTDRTRAGGCRCAPRTPTPRTAPTRRLPTRAACRCGDRSWRTPTWSTTPAAGWRAGSPHPSRS